MKRKQEPVPVSRPDCRAYLWSAEETLDRLDASPEGLSAAEAKRRAGIYGGNRLRESKRKNIFLRFLGELANPMVIVLIVAAAVSAATAALAGESFADVVIILAVVAINAVLGVVQESKAEKAIGALQKMTAPTARVRRDGTLTRVKTEELVPGDLVALEAGDSVPADARLIEAYSLKAEESALTGESVPVSKSAERLEPGRDGAVALGDRTNCVYMGTTIVYGRCTAAVTATGMNTEMGKIAGAIAEAKESRTPLQAKLAQLSKILSFLVLGICVLIFAVDVLRALPGVTGESLLSTFMIAVSLAVAAIPEGLAAVVTIVLSAGVTKMAKKRAVVRKLTAVETLGCTEIICSDKTGTLTQNRMTVTECRGDARRVAAAMALCTDAEWNGSAAEGEPTECALVDYAASLGLVKTELAERSPRIGEAPFDSTRKMMTTLHADGGGAVQYTKGAPDEIIRRCTRIVTESGSEPLTEERRAEMLAANKEMADRALRVLAVAEKRYAEAPDAADPAALENDMTLLGLAGMIDPVRPEVKAAIAECRQAGIRPVMITGDHRDTAVAIARELGILDDAAQAVTGEELDAISDTDFVSEVERIRVYARVRPEHKVRIVNAWRAKGYVTAMTGDGVNDAPSIKAADIGVGMGVTGTDVTKNVADMVLADDNFATIVSAVEEGRRIYDNIRKAIQFLLASNLAEVVAIFIATMMGFQILKPVHLLWINLLTDTFPALALGMEPGDRDLMKRPPRSSRDGIFAGGVGLHVCVQGCLIGLLTLSSYFVGHWFESGLWEITASADGMSMAFMTLSMTEMLHAFNMRSPDRSLFGARRQNPLLWAATGVSLLLTTAVLYLPGLSAAFGFSAISAVEYLIAIGLGALILPLVEIEKLAVGVWRRRASRRAKRPEVRS